MSNEWVDVREVPREPKSAPKESKKDSGGWEDVREIAPAAQAAGEAGDGGGFMSDALQLTGIPEPIAKWTAKNVSDPLLKDVVAPVGRFVDRYTGAPTRSSVGALQEGKNPLTAFKNQFGEDPENAPTGREIAQKAGFSDKSLSDVFPALYNETGEGLPLQKGGWADPTASGSAGLGVDVLADWTNLIPVGAAAKVAGRATGKLALNTAEGTAKVVPKVAAAAVDLATGSKAGSQTLEKVTDALGSVIKPKINPEYERFVEIAKKNGIEPQSLSSAIEFGPDSYVSRAERSLMEGATGQQLRESHNAGLTKIRDTFQSKVKSISANKSLDPVSAGVQLRDAAEKGMNEFFDKLDITYEKVQKYAPGVYMDRDALAKIDSKMNGLEKRAKLLEREGLTPAEQQAGAALQRVVEQYRNGKPTLKRMTDRLQHLGDYAFGKKGRDLPLDRAELQGIYNAMKDGVIETVRKHVNPDFADELVANNEAMTQFFRETEPIKDLVREGKRVAPERLFDQFFSDTSKVEALKRVLPPEAMNQAKGAYLQSMLRRGQDGEILFGSTMSRLRDDDVFKALFAPQEQKEVLDLLELGHAYGPKGLTPSAGGMSFNDIAKGIRNGIANEQFVGAAKNRARQAYQAEKGIVPEAATSLLDEEGKVSGDFLLRAVGRGAGLRDNAVSQGLKAAQVGSVHESSLLKMLARNPSMLQHIKNPALRQQLGQQLGISAEESEDKSKDPVQSLGQSQQRFIQGNGGMGR